MEIQSVNLEIYVLEEQVNDVNVVQIVDYLVVVKNDKFEIVLTWGALKD